MKRSLLSLTFGVVLLMTGTAFAGGDVHWGYSGHEGPEHWGDLCPEFNACGTGRNQSPINLTGMVEADLPPIGISYSASPLKIVNNGHTVKVDCSPGSEIRVDDENFRLLQYHFHAPSENWIEGKSFAMEAHLVHANEKGELAVIALMFDEGKANPALESIWEKMPEGAGDTVAAEDVSIDATSLFPKDRSYFRFNGSLTTPPCTEGVRWLVMKESVEASKEQIEKFHHAMHHDNNRPIQPAYARTVLK